MTLIDKVVKMMYINQLKAVYIASIRFLFKVKTLRREQILERLIGKRLNLEKIN